MSRYASPAGSRSGRRRENPARFIRRRVASGKTFLAAAVIGAALSGAVAADTLAQPQDTALERRAADYIRFREDVAAIEATPFDSAKITRDAHKRLSAHSSKELSSGWVAYAALVAASTPDFVAALQKDMKKRGPGGLRGKDAFLARLSADPSYARKLKGAKAASARVLSMTAQDVHRFAALGEAFKTQAYAMQKTSWGKKRIAASSKRLSEAEAYARARGPAPAPALAVSTDKGVTAPVLASVDAAWSPDWGAQGSARDNEEPNAQVIMDRVLNLAARYAVGGVNEKIVDVYAKNDRADQCLSMAALTLKQCIAATRTPYEEAFCLGEHALIDPAACIGWVAGAEADQG